jgi:heme oxygenase
LAPSRVVQHLRSVTSEAHRRLESKLDVIARLADPVLRPGLLERYADLHIPADAMLGRYLGSIDGLDIGARRRTPLLEAFVRNDPLPTFPRPASRAQALGMLYVLEGSTLGGRLILRMLAERGINDPDLEFLDPYGPDAGLRWRSFLSVLSRETDHDDARVSQAGTGAVLAFAHAEHVLCGDAA